MRRPTINKLLTRPGRPHHHDPLPANPATLGQPRQADLHALQRDPSRHRLRNARQKLRRWQAETLPVWHVPVVLRNDQGAAPAQVRTPPGTGRQSGTSRAAGAFDAGHHRPRVRLGLGRDGRGRRRGGATEQAMRGV
uniref:(northern house mosquito) hypothetical protein n=1 Tax=Culex pipiens TaxID=7175 RepID=A0A8D8G1Y9_CULPI